MIDHLDHIVLTTRDKDACIRFYSGILGMRLEKFSTPTGERLALKFGQQKINLHEWGREFDPKAHVPVPGSLDLCFIASAPLEEVIGKLAGAGYGSDHAKSLQIRQFFSAGSVFSGLRASFSASNSYL